MKRAELSLSGALKGSVEAVRTENVVLCRSHVEGRPTAAGGAWRCYDKIRKGLLRAE